MGADAANPEPLDLEAIKARVMALSRRISTRSYQWYGEDVPALVAEVERLRRENESLSHGLTAVAQSFRVDL